MPRQQPSADRILQQLAEQNTEKVRVAITDMDGVLRGKMISFEKFTSIVEKGFGFCNVVFGWDSADAAYDNTEYTGWHTGYPDAPVAIDLLTFRKIPWENDSPFFLAELIDNKNIVRKSCIIALLKKLQCRRREHYTKKLNHRK